MNERMKVLIAYDGSAHADAALEDLRRAGLPREAEALIVSVSHGLVSTSSPIADIPGTAPPTSRRVRSAMSVGKEEAARLLVEAKEFAAQARTRIRSKRHRSGMPIPSSSARVGWTTLKRNQTWAAIQRAW